MNKKPAKEEKSELVDDKGIPIMRVKVYSPFKSYFDDMAYSISAENLAGPFDILPRHHNFMTLIKAGELKIVAASGDQVIPISQGLMHVKADEIVVFLDI